MTDGNGHPPLAFPPVPTVGQPLTIKAWYVVALGLCQCRTPPEPIVIFQGTVVQCPSCKRGWAIGTVTTTPDGGIGLGINMIPAPAAADPRKVILTP